MEENITLTDSEEMKASDVEAETPVDAEDAGAEPEAATESEQESTDYEKMATEDLDILRHDFPELRELGHISEIDNPLRYATLRDLGLTPQEAYLATRKRRESDTRAHLFDTVGRAASAPAAAMSQRELAEARELFGNMSDADLHRLYRRVSG